MRKRTLLFTLLCFIASGFALGQPTKQLTTFYQNWYDFTETVRVKNWSIIASGSERHFIKPLAQSQGMVRLYALYNFPQNWSAGLGMAALFTKEGTITIPELRPEQWVMARHKFDKLKWLGINHRWKVEERFVHNAVGDSLTAGYTFTMRFRYRLGLDFTLFKTGKDENPFKLLVNEEVFLNAGKTIVYNVFDQERLNAGFSYRPIKGLTISLLYMHIYKQKKAGNKFEQTHVLRIGIEHEFGIPARKREANKS